MADIHQPHDRLFRAVFAEASEAASLLQAALPETLRNNFDWTTLARQGGTFIDEDLRASQTDLLYQVEHVATGHPVLMYMLFEHQSSPDAWLRLRLLRYCCRIWEADRRDDPERRELRPIVPVVFYQGTRSWNHSQDLADLFPEAVRSSPWVPRFTHVLLDQTALEPEAIAGSVKARLAQLLVMAAAERHVEEALRSAAPLIVLLYGGEDGRNEARPFFLYLATTQEPEVIEEFRTALQRHGLERGGEIMATYAQELLAEGKAKGRAEGLMEGEQRAKVEIVEGLLRAGVTWDVIEAATGMTEADFQALKAQLSGADL